MRVRVGGWLPHQSVGPPQVALMLIVRYFLSQMVGLATDFCGPLQATPGPTLFCPVPVGGLVSGHLSSL